MTEQALKLLLVEREEFCESGPKDSGHTYSTPGARDPQKSRDLLAAIDKAASERDVARTSREVVKSSFEVSDGNRQYYGGSISTTEVIQIITYAGASAAGLAAFVHHTLGAVLDWIELREGRSARIDVLGTEMEIKDGMTAVEVVSKINKIVEQKRQNGK